MDQAPLNVPKYDPFAHSEMHTLPPLIVCITQLIQTENHMAPRGAGALVLKYHVAKFQNHIYVIQLKLSVDATIQFEIHL